MVHTYLLPLLYDGGFHRLVVVSNVKDHSFKQGRCRHRRSISLHLGRITSLSSGRTAWSSSYRGRARAWLEGWFFNLCLIGVQEGLIPTLVYCSSLTGTVLLLAWMCSAFIHGLCLHRSASHTSCTRAQWHRGWGYRWQSRRGWGCRGRRLQVEGRVNHRRLNVECCFCVDGSLGDYFDIIMFTVGGYLLHTSCGVVL